MASLPEGQSLPAAGSSTDTDDRASKKFPGRFTLTEGSKPKARFTFSEPSKKKATRRGSESRLSSNGRVMTQHEEWKNDIEEKVRAKEAQAALKRRPSSRFSFTGSDQGMNLNDMMIQAKIRKEEDWRSSGRVRSLCGLQRQRQV